MERLKDEELEEFKKAFRVFDTDGDGQITTREIARVMRKLNRFQPERELLDKVNEIDLDGNGAIEFEEFVSYLVGKMKENNDNDDELRDAFRVYAGDNRNFITPDSLRSVMAILDQKLSDEEIDGMMAEADVDGDGLISYEDFVNVMTCRY